MQKCLVTSSGLREAASIHPGPHWGWLVESKPAQKEELSVVLACSGTEGVSPQALSSISELASAFWHLLGRPWPHNAQPAWRKRQILGSPREELNLELNSELAM